MKSYEILKKDGEQIGNIRGDSLIQAVEENFTRIIGNQIGNSAGYELENVWMEYVGEGIAELHVIACGSDNLVNYDAINDKPKEVIFEIHNVAAEEILDGYSFELNREEPFNPFDEKWHSNKMACLGILIGTINYIGQNHCKSPDKNVLTIQINVSTRFPTLLKANTQAFLNQMNLCLQRFRPKEDKKTKELLERVEKMTTLLMDIRQLTLEEEGRATFFTHKTEYALRLQNKKTALYFYREKSGKSQQQVADEVGISLRQYQRYEAVTSTISDAKFTVVKKIADVLDISVEKILKNGQVVHVSE